MRERATGDHVDVATHEDAQASTFSAKKGDMIGLRVDSWGEEAA